MRVRNLWVRSLRPRAPARTPLRNQKVNRPNCSSVKDKRMTKNGPEFLIGWRDFPLERDDTWEPISDLTGCRCILWKRRWRTVTSSLVLSFMNTCMKNLAGDGSIKQSWFGKGNERSEFPVSSAHESVKSARKSVREDLELRWVTNLSEERKRFYLIATLAPNCCLSVTTNTSPRPGKTRVTYFFQWSLNVFIWIILKEKSMIRKYKSLNLAFWMTSWVSVSHQWMSTRFFFSHTPVLTHDYICN